MPDSRPRGALTALETETWPAEAEAVAAPAESSRARWSRPLMIGAVAVLLLAAAVFGARWFTVGRYLETTDDAYLQADSTVISPKVTGYIAEVAVTDNQHVTAGQLLARIDDRDYRAALAQADAEVASTAADLRNVEAQIVQQQAHLAGAEAERMSAEAQRDYAGSESERYRGLVESGAVSRQKEQLATTDLKRSAAATAEARATVDAAQAQLEILRTQHDKVAAAQQSAEAVREQARLNLAYTALSAPVDGVVGDRAARVGQYVQPGARLMTVVPVGDIYLVANFKETQLGAVYRGEKVEIVLDTYPDRTIEGTVDSLAPGTGAQFALLPPENATGNFTKIVQRVPVKILLDPKSLDGIALRPGLSATATIDTRTAPASGRTTLAPTPVSTAPAAR